MKKIFLLVTILLLTRLFAYGSLPIKQADEFISYHVYCLDSAGIDMKPDSVHVHSFQDAGAASSFDTRSTSFPFSGIGIDTTKIYGDTNYIFSDQIQDIDGSPTPTAYTMTFDVVMWGDGIATHNPYSVQVVRDSFHLMLDSIGLAAVDVAGIAGAIPPTNWASMAITAAGIVDADLETIEGDATSSVDFKDFVDNGYEPIADAIVLVSNVGTVTTATNAEAMLDTMKYCGPNGKGVWLNESAANTNTVLGVDGTESNPVSTFAAARTIADNLGSKRYYFVDRASFTGGSDSLATTTENWEFYGLGEGNAIGLDQTGPVNVDGSYFYNMTITGAMGGTGEISIENGRVGDFHGANGHFHNTGLLDTITIGTNDDLVLANCFSEVAGNGRPGLSFGAGNSNVSMRNYSGGIEIHDANSSDNISIEGRGQIVVNADCTTPAITVRGLFTLTDNDVTTWTKTANFYTTEVAPLFADTLLTRDTSDISGASTFAQMLKDTSSYQGSGAAGPDSATISRIMHRIAHGTPQGSGSDSSTLAQRDVQVAGMDADVMNASALATNAVDEIMEYDTSLVSGAQSWVTMLKDTSAYQGGAAGLDSGVVSNIMHRVVWGTAVGSGSDSSTLAQRDVTIADLLDNVIDSTHIADSTITSAQWATSLYDQFADIDSLVDATWNEDSTGHYTSPNMAFISAQTAASNLDSTILSNILHRIVHGTPVGSGSDSSTLAERDVTVASILDATIDSGNFVDGAFRGRHFEDSYWDSLANRSDSGAAGGTGLDSATTSRLLHRVIWGTAQGSGSDSSTLAERDASMKNLSEVAETLAYNSEPEWNLVRNGSFERDSAVSNTAPDLWVKGDGTHTNDESQVSLSDGRWQFHIDPAVNETSTVYQHIGEVPAGHYWLSGILKTNTNIQKAVWLVVDDAIPTTTSEHIDSIGTDTNTTTGEHYGKIFTHAGGDLYVGMVVYNQALGYDGFFDDITIIPMGFDTSAYRQNIDSLLDAATNIAFGEKLWEYDSNLVSSATGMGMMLKDTTAYQGAGMDSTTLSNILHRIVWGTPVGSGSDSSTQAERDVTIGALEADVIDANTIAEDAFDGGMFTDAYFDSIANRSDSGSAGGGGSDSATIQRIVNRSMRDSLNTIHGDGQYDAGAGTGSGTDSVLVYNSTTSAVVPYVKVTLRNITGTSDPLGIAETNGDGIVVFLVNDSGQITIAQPGITGILDTLNNETGIDTLFVTSFNPSAPAGASFSRAYGWMKDGQGNPVIEGDIFMTLQGNNLRDTSEGVWVSNSTLTAQTDSVGYFFLDIRKTSLLNRATSYRVVGKDGRKTIFTLPGFKTLALDSVEVKP